MSWAANIRVRRNQSHRSFELDFDSGSSAAVTAVIGPNGSGKSTLLQALVGGVRPNSGFIHLGGESVFDASAGIDQPPEKRRIAYVPQGYGLFEHMTREKMLRTVRTVPWTSSALFISLTVRQSSCQEASVSVWR